MANDLHIFFDNAMTNQISEGTNLNPDVITGDGETGFVDTLILYMGNNNNTDFYDNIQITADGDNVDVDLTYSILIGGPYLDPLNFGVTIGHNSTQSFYRRLTVTAGEPATHITTIKHKTTATEHPG